MRSVRHYTERLNYPCVVLIAENIDGEYVVQITVSLTQLRAAVSEHSHISGAFVNSNKLVTPICKN